MIDIRDRICTYDKDYCWQYDVRLNNFKEDLDRDGLTREYISTLRVSDFSFKEVINKDERRDMIDFIQRHEWLGTISQYTTHWFACYHKMSVINAHSLFPNTAFDKNILSGVILFNMPNAFSKILGEDTNKLERLISRGACISWSPKNLASAFLMWCIKWMVKTTDYRLFTAYSDPTARELGTIYQACNFYYLGQKSGTTSRYINPYTGKIVSDRFFRQRSAYKKYAYELKILWQNAWSNSHKMLWGNIPDDIERRLREFSKQKQRGAEKIKMPSKHKYAYVLGRDGRETKKLRKLFEARNVIYEYPKKRGE